MKLTEALALIQENIEKALVAAGLIDGLTLETADQIINEEKTIFWPYQITSKEASEKPEYLVWNFGPIDASKYGDGKVLAYKFKLTLTLWSNNAVVSNILSAIETQLSTNGYVLEFDKSDYDNSSKLYYYRFTAKNEVRDN